MAPCAAGENDVALAPGLRRERRGRERRAAAGRRCPSRSSAPEEVHTPGLTTIDAVAGQPRRARRRAAEGLPGRRRGPRARAWSSCAATTASTRSSSRNALGEPFRPGARRARSPTRIGPPGFIGPVGAQASMLLDDARGRADGRLRHGRERARPPPRAASSPAATSPSSASTCARSRPGDTVGGAARSAIEPAIEIGNIFQLGTRYSEPLGATYLDENGSEQPIWMGSYGIGPARIVAAAVEQFADEHGISLAAGARALGRRARRAGQAGHAEREAAEALYEELRARRAATSLYDDRDAGPGEKFADAELLGVPLRLTVGQALARVGRGRGPGAPRARPDVEGGVAARRGSERGRRRAARSPCGRARPRLTFRRLSGLDRSGPPPPADAAPARRWHPWTIPNAIGFVRLALIPVFLVVALCSSDGDRRAAPRSSSPSSAWSDYADGIAARVTGQYSRFGALLDPVVDRLLVRRPASSSAGSSSCCRAGRSRAGRARGCCMLVARRASRCSTGVELQINWPGRAGPSGRR